MTVFVDTSALLALVVATDRFHPVAARVFESLRSHDARLLTTSYVLVETYALLGRRHGTPAIRGFREKLAPALEVVWVDGELHEKGLDWLLARGVEQLSLVDAISCVVARAAVVDQVFAFDPDFAREGFRLMP